MKFSVIIPVYNVAPWIGKALDSLCAQTFRDFEVIVVNDGSTDDSVAIVNKYIGRLGIKLVSQPNRGLSAARNAGLSRAVGEFVYMMDSDDSIHPSLLAFAARGLSSGADFVVFDCRFVRGGDALPVVDDCGGYREFPLPKGSVRWFLDHRRGPMVWQYAFRRAVLSERRFIEGIVFEDYPFSLPVHADASLRGVYIPCRLYLYYQRPRSVIHRIDWRKWMMSFEKGLAEIRMHLSAADYESVVRTFYARMIRSCWRAAAVNEKPEMLDAVVGMARAGLIETAWLAFELRWRLWFYRKS